MVATATPSLQTAFEYHRSGDLQGAETACREVLRVDPRHADAWHLLGVVAFQKNESVTAVDYIGQAIDSDGTRPEYHNSLGNVYRSLRRPVEAITEFRAALRLKPDFSVAYNNLGIVLAELGQDRGATACFEQAVQLDQKNANAWTNLGSALLDRGRLQDAQACFECAIEADSQHGTAYAKLGRARSRARKFEQAIIAYEWAIELGTEDAALLKDLAESYLQVGRSAEAERVYRRAIVRSPNDSALLLNLAQALKDQKKFDEAIDWYRRGLVLDPQNAAAHYTLGRALHLTDRFAEAIIVYQKSLALGSTDPKCAYHLGNACKSLKRLNEAIEAYLKALEWDPDFVAALYQLGNAYRHLNDFDGARICLEKVVARQPDDLFALASLGNVQKAQDDFSAASATFKKVLSRVPDDSLWQLWLETLCPTVFHSTVGIEQFRTKLRTALKSFADKNLSVSAEDITDRGCPPPYNLQFHGRDDKELKEAYAAVFRNFRGATEFDYHRGPATEEKPRVGFVVTNGHEGVFLRYLRGTLQRLDRERFDPVIICSAGGESRIRQDLPVDVIETLVIPSRFEQVVERVRAGRFAVLYYWEIGSDTTNYFLPFFRPAPIQCTGAGLPVTSGLPQVDYFLSNDVCEPDRAERSYTERLIRSRSLLTWQKRMELPDGPRPRSDFGVAENEHFYLCPHKIEKFHPDFDGLLGDILARDPRGVLVIPQDRHGYAARKLQNRLRLVLPHVIDRIRFVPHQTLGNYLGLVNAADVLLDPIYYGGGLTSFDGLSFSKPIVTWPGEYVRGRYTFGFYCTMGVEECIAGNPEEYVSLAVRLGTDRDWRMHVAERIRQTSDVLFEAVDSVQEYDRIFGQLVDEATRDG